MLSTRFKGMVRLFRPELPLAAGICTLTGQALALGKLPPPQVGLLGFLAVFFLSASALILNDYFDYEVDRVNAPWRPLPAGMVSKSDVIGLGTAATLAGFAAAAAIGRCALLLSIPIWLIGFLYNWRYKQSGLPGNLMVSLSVAGTFIFGAVTVQAPWTGVVWVFSLMAFFIDLGEEIAGDAMDMEGDRRCGSRSIALLKGRRFVLRISVTLWCLAILLSLLPALLGWIGVLPLLPILAGDALLVYFSIQLLRSQDEESGHRAMLGAYLGMSLCVLAFLAGLVLG